MTTYDTDKSDLEKKISDADQKIPDTIDLAKKTDLNDKITEIEGKIPSIIGLDTNSALAAVENKTDVTSLITKTGYNTKISEVEKKVSDHNHDRYITTPDFNNLAARVFNARLAEANLVTKTDFDIKLQSLNKKINSNKTKHLLVETELKKIEKFDAANFRGKNIFDGDGTQNYLVFQPIYRYFKMVLNSVDKISLWESKGLSDEKMYSIIGSSSGTEPELVYDDDARIKIKFIGDLLSQDKVTCNHGPKGNIYIVYRDTRKDDAISIMNNSSLNEKTGSI